MLNDMAKVVHSVAVDKGFWDEKINDIFIAKQCMMIVSEVTELMESVRKNKESHEVVEEIADILIRTLDLYQGMLNNKYIYESLDNAVTNKIAKNRGRAKKHGVKF